jgi:KUP system potassium uptake protein
MEAAYGLAITMAMISTTILMTFYLHIRYRSSLLSTVFATVYLTLEIAFLVANLSKFPHGGWVSLLISLLLLAIMYTWISAFHIKRSLTEYVRLKHYLPALQELSADETVPKYTTHLVFMTSAPDPKKLESKVIYSIFQKRPKRADIYWFIHVDTTDAPYTAEYKVRHMAQGDVIRIDFKLGFRVEQRINLFFRKVVEELVEKGEVDITSRYPSLNKQQLIGDFRFVVLEKYLSVENDLPLWKRLIMQWYFNIKEFTSSETKWFGLDTSSVKVEKVPLVIRPVQLPDLKRIPA